MHAANSTGLCMLFVTAVMQLLSAACSVDGVPLTKSLLLEIQKGRKEASSITPFITSIPANEFKGFAGNITLRGLPLLQSVGDEAFCNMTGTLVIDGGNLLELTHVGDRAFFGISDPTSSITFGSLPQLQTVGVAAFSSMKGKVSVIAADLHMLASQGSLPYHETTQQPFERRRKKRAGTTGKPTFQLQLVNANAPNARTGPTNTTVGYTDPTATIKYYVGDIHKFAPRTIDTERSHVSAGSIDNITYTLSSEAPLSLFVQAKNGVIMGQFEEAKKYSFELLALDAGGERATVEAFSFEVEERGEFKVLEYEYMDSAVAAPQLTDDAYSDPSTTAIYAVGETYRFKPINIKRIEHSPDENRLDKLVFTVEGSPGFLIDPKDGYVQGIPLYAGEFNMSLFALDSRNEKALVGTPISMIIKQQDDANLTFGPEGRGCKNGNPRDSVLFDQRFSCDCTGTSFTGPNCDIEVTDTTAEVVVLMLGVFVLLILLVTLGAYVARKHQQRRLTLMPYDFEKVLLEMIESGELSTEQVQGLAASQDKRVSMFTRNMSMPREIPRRCIERIEKIGEGAFGDVFKGILDETSHNNGVPGYMVACKSVIDPDGEGAKDLLQEAAVMAQIGYHVNLVSLIGVVTSGLPLLIIIALCENGSLKSQLEKRALGEGKLAVKPGAIPTKIDADIALEIARGMQHLAERRFVHRDLASRNILLDSQLVAKVADFGLSRRYEENAHHYKSDHGMMALRWTAPEAMETLNFSLKSDIWAFGVVLLEIAIDGGLPLAELSNDDIMRRLQAGYQTPRPPMCSNSMYTIMRRCWDLDALNRPSFTELIDMLDADEMHDFSSSDSTLVFPSMEEGACPEFHSCASPTGHRYSSEGCGNGEAVPSGASTKSNLYKSFLTDLKRLAPGEYSRNPVETTFGTTAGYQKVCNEREEMVRRKSVGLLYVDKSGQSSSQSSPPPSFIANAGYVRKAEKAVEAEVRRASENLYTTIETSSRIEAPIFNSLPTCGSARSLSGLKARASTPDLLVSRGSLASFTAAPENSPSRLSVVSFTATPDLKVSRSSLASFAAVADQSPSRLSVGSCTGFPDHSPFQSTHLLQLPDQSPSRISLTSFTGFPDQSPCHSPLSTGNIVTHGSVSVGSSPRRDSFSSPGSGNVLFRTVV